MKNAHFPKPLGRRGERGLALLVALIILVVMSLAGIALVRSIDTGLLVAGNLAFRQSSMHAGQKGVEAARQWLLDHRTALDADQASAGYYANAQDTLDLTGNLTPGSTTDDVKWEGAAGMSTPRCLAQDDDTNTTCYIIHRLCAASGEALASSGCTIVKRMRGGSSQGAIRQETTYQQAAWISQSASGYYRITVRTSGPHNTISFLQAFVTI